MRRYIRVVPIIPRVPRQIHISTQHRDILRRRHHPIPSINVILRTDMHIPEFSKRPWRQSGYRVVVMRRSVIPAFVLVRDVVAQNGWGDAWCAVRVEVGDSTSVPDLGGGDGSDGPAETVSYDYDAVGWVCGGGGFERCEDADPGFQPAIVAVVTVSVVSLTMELQTGKVKA